MSPAPHVVHQAEGDGVGGDAEAGVLEGEGAHESHPAALARRVGGDADVDAGVARARRDGDDPPPGLLDHRVDHGVNTVEDPAQVHLDGAVPLARIHLAEGSGDHRLGAAVARVVDEDVDGAAAVERGSHGAEVGDVERHRRGAVAALVDRRGDLGGPVGVEVVDQHGGALGRQRRAMPAPAFCPPR